MPIIKSILDCDSDIKFACKSCNESIEESSIVECDECGSQYHERCLGSNGNSSSPDLIQLCTLCACENQIYSPKQQSIEKLPRKSLIPIATENANVKQLRSRVVTIDGAKSAKQRQSSKCTKPTKSNENEFIANLEGKLIALETRMASFETAQCKCSEIADSKIAGLESKIKEYHEFVATHFSQFAQPPNANNTDLDFKSDFDIDSLRFRIHFADKISGIEETIKEDRMLVEQLFVNQMNTVQKQLDTQEQTVKCYETLSELIDSRDSSAPDEFEDLKAKLISIEKSIEIQNKVLHHLSSIVSRHNNSLVTHFELNKAYCADLVSKSQSSVCELNALKHEHSNGKEATTSLHGSDNAKRTQTPTNTQTKSNAEITQRRSIANNNNGCMNDTQLLRTEPTAISVEPITSSCERVSVTSEAQMNGVPQHEHQMKQNTSTTTSKASNSKSNSKHTQLQSTHEHTNSGDMVSIQTMMYNGRRDNRRFKIHMNDASQFVNEKSIRSSIGEALFSFLPHLKQESCELVSNRLNFDPISLRIMKCTMVVVLPHSINVPKFTEFINRFLSERGSITNNG